MIKPDPSSRHPLIIFLLLLCFISGSGIFLGSAPAPGTINAMLPWWEVQIWSAMLVIGAGATLLGLALQPTRLRDGVLLEQFGMAALAPTALLYGLAAVIQAGLAALLPAGIIIGLAASCAYRWHTLQRDVKKSKALMAKLAEENPEDGEGQRAL